MTALIERLARRRPLKVGGSPAGRKEWSGEPEFWTLDSLRHWWASAPPYSGREQIDNDFAGYVQLAFKDNGVVFACILARQMLFSEARFQWRRFVAGRPGDMFGTPELALLENPWPGGTTGELLARMESDASLAGNFFATTADDDGRVGNASIGGRNRRVVRMRPDWMTIVSGSRSDSPHALDAQVVGYLYRPPSGDDETLLAADEVCHYSPIPDPAAQWRGMSWMTPVLKEIEGDKAATVHKGRFFRNGATPALAVSLDKDVEPDAFDRFVTAFNLSHKGSENAYKTLFLGGGADVKPLTMDLRSLDFKSVQGGGETRLASAARVPAIIVGLSEGLAAQTYSNYTQARRHFADGTMRPLWRMAAASLQCFLRKPENANLWYDARDISFLQEDLADAAQIAQTKAATISSLIDAGYEPDSVVRAVEADDFSLLVGRHTGLYSVQLQQPGTQQPQQQQSEVLA